MPNFVKTKKDEKRWSVAKKAAARSKGKDENSLHDDDYALVNYIYHKMGKTEEDQELAKSFKLKLKPMPKTEGMGTNVPNPTKTGTVSTAVRAPRPKKHGKATDKPSVFFKSQDANNIKSASIGKLRVFLDNIQKKRNLK